MARGLLENDLEWRICLEEAIAMQPGMACHWLLAVILHLSSACDLSWTIEPLMQSLLKIAT